MAVTKPFQTAICQMAHLLLLFPDYISLVGFFEDLFIPRLTKHIILRNCLLILTVRNQSKFSLTVMVF